MKRMKTFFIYAMLVIGVILLTDVFANLVLETGYRTIKEYNINTTSPKIEIVQAETTNANGRIKGTITNNTNSLLQGQFIKIDLLSDLDNVVGTEYLQIGNLQPGESKKFSLNYRYSNVDSFIVSVQSKDVEEELFEYNELVEKGIAAYKLVRLATIGYFPSVFFVIWLLIGSNK